MVHSVVKIQAYLLQSAKIVPLDEVLEQAHPSAYETPSPESPFSQEDPKDLLQTTLKYLSDRELYNLIITRLSKAVPNRPPLYLTPTCIEGIHDFFHPVRPVTDSALLSSLESTEAAVCNPFGRMPITRRDSARLGQKFNLPNPRRHYPALLTSLAMLLSFLEPAELRNVIQKRIADSVSLKPIECFREFLASGGDDVPAGQLQAMKKRVLARDILREKKRKRKMAAEKHGEGSFMPPAATSSMDAETSNMQRHDDSIPAVDPARSFSNLELEDGEILPRTASLAQDLPRSSTRPFSSLSPSRGAAAPAPHTGHSACSGTPPPPPPPPPPKKRRKRATKGALRAQREVRSHYALTPCGY